MVAIVSIIVPLLCARLLWQTDNNGRNIEEAKNIAQKEFMMDRVYFTSHANVLDNSKSVYAIYVCGERENDTVLVYVPSDYSEKSIEIPWMFGVSFKEIVQMVYGMVSDDMDTLRGIEILDEYSAIKKELPHINSDEFLENYIESNDSDSKYMLRLRRDYAVFRISGQIKIYKYS